jgi:hypothetical protein
LNRTNGQFRGVNQMFLSRPSRCFAPEPTLDGVALRSWLFCPPPPCADSHASDENPDVHQLSFDGPLAFEQNICPRLNRTNGHFCVSTSGLPARRSPELRCLPSPSLCLWLAFIAGRTPSRKCHKARTSLSA